MEAEKEEFQNPYYIFPDNVWEQILEKVKDSKDIQNVLKAFPVLKEDLQFAKRKQYWLMDQVLPFISPKYKPELDKNLCCVVDEFNNKMKNLLLNCRLVCKRWAAAVDKLLEDKFQVNDHLHNKPASDWNDYQRYNSPRIYPSFTFPTQPYWFINPECFFNFEDKMGSHPPNKNPFLSRSITVSSEPGKFIIDACEVQSRFGNENEIFDKELLWRNVLNLFENFGTHLYEFRIFVGREDMGSLSFWQEFCKGIGKLPNLKRLEITGERRFKDDWNETRLNEIRFTSQHPHLTQLIIDQNSIPVVLANHIISLYSAQLRKLELHNGSRDWMEIKGSDTFPKLKELSIQNSSEGGTTITNWLNTITAPGLTRLIISVSARSTSLSIKQDVFCWLKHFTQLKYLEVNMDKCFSQAECLITENAYFTEEDIKSLASLEYLKIPDSFWLTFNFLQVLPALRHLHIVTGNAAPVHIIPTGSKIIPRELIQTGQFYESAIWSVLPSLRTITLTIVQSNWYSYSKKELKFDRTTFNELMSSATQKYLKNYPFQNNIYLETDI